MVRSVILYRTEKRARGLMDGESEGKKGERKQDGFEGPGGA